MVIQMVLPSSDRYALILVAWFLRLDGLTALQYPNKPPAPNMRVQNETLQVLQSAAFKEALQRWEADYL